MQSVTITQNVVHGQKLASNPLKRNISVLHLEMLELDPNLILEDLKSSPFDYIYQLSALGDALYYCMKAVGVFDNHVKVK